MHQHYAILNKVAKIDIHRFSSQEVDRHCVTIKSIDNQEIIVLRHLPLHLCPGVARQHSHLSLTVG